MALNGADGLLSAQYGQPDLILKCPGKTVLVSADN